jgi:hypothetical protein
MGIFFIFFACFQRVLRVSLRIQRVSSVSPACLQRVLFVFSESAGSGNSNGWYLHGGEEGWVFGFDLLPSAVVVDA